MSFTKQRRDRSAPDRTVAGCVPRGAGAARDQRFELSRDRRCHRHPGRHGDVAAGAGARALARRLAGGGERVMNCEEARILVHALADGELDAGHAREVETHVAQCKDCAAELAAAREMTQALRATPLGFAVPASLTAKIDRVVPTPMPVTNRRALLKGFAFGGVASALAAASVGLVVLREGQAARILGAAISAQLRSHPAAHLP